MKIISWNVNGIRAFSKKIEFDWLFKQKADFICLQETKAHPEQLSKDIINPKNYYSYFDHSKTKKGYSGVVIYTKEKPLKIIYGLGKKDLDLEGRQITLVYKDFVLINCYFPNGGGENHRLEYKLKYFDEFLKFVKKLQKTCPKIIFCGDINIAHNEIDLTRPKENSKEIGFLPIERKKLDNFYKNNFIDIYRELHPKKIEYTWWDMKTRARDRNVGWRIDYFWISKNLITKTKKSLIHNDILGSDHCPIYLEINL